MTHGRPVGILAGTAVRPLVDSAVAACGSDGAATATAWPGPTASQLGTINKRPGHGC
jgi:hypothetical protein